MKINIVSLILISFKLIKANQEFYESSGEGRCNAFFKCPLKDKFTDLAKIIPEGTRLEEKYYKCCSPYGMCGETKEHCGEGCQNGDCLSLVATRTNDKCSTYKKSKKCDEDCPCPEGQCCSKYGYCGKGSSYCGSITTTTTTTKKSTTINNNSTVISSKCSTYKDLRKCDEDCPCPEGQCCSKYGYCGKGSSYCGSTTTTTTTTASTTFTNTIETTSTTSTTTNLNSTESTSITLSAGKAGIVVYLPYYGLNRLNLTTFDFTGIDVVNYAFLRLDDTGSAFMSDSKLDTLNGIGVIPYLNTVIKKKYPNLKTVISVGGASGSKNWSKFMNNTSLLNKAVEEVVGFCINNGFDGVDVDWETPADLNENGYYLTFIMKLREALGNDRLLTQAGSKKPEKYHGYVSKFAKYLDWINIMSYHYAGTWNKYAGLNSPLYQTPDDKNKQKSCDQTIKAYMDEGVPASKLVVGTSFYGRTWEVESSTNDGFNQIGNGNVKGQASDTKNDATWTYYALRTENVLSGKTSAKYPWRRTWREPAMSPTVFNTKDNRYISYEDVESMRERAKYAKKMGLAGVMVWEISQDYQNELINELINQYKS